MGNQQETKSIKIKYLTEWDPQRLFVENRQNLLIKI